MQNINVKITGPVGSGKTTIAAILAAELQKYGFSVTSDEPNALHKIKGDILRARKENIPIHSSINIISVT
jgi:adenylylsulfate kinase-like enzyme